MMRASAAVDDDMDESWFRSFVGDAGWIFAKTMPESPHWYTLRLANDKREFERAVLDIRAFGSPRRYRGRDYICYEIDGMIYWSMGAPLEETILINRAQAS